MSLFHEVAGYKRRIKPCENQQLAHNCPNCRPVHHQHTNQREVKMNNLVIFVIAGAFLCGAAVGQKKNDYESCKAAGDCKNNCCLDRKYCAPPVNGTCSQENMEKACKNPESTLAKALCPLIKAIANLIPQMNAGEPGSGLVQQLLTAVIGLLTQILGLLGEIPELEPVISGLIKLLKGLNVNLGDLLAGLNVGLADLLDALIG